MRKLIAILCLAALVGCASQPAATTEPTATDEPTLALTGTPPASGDVLVSIRRHGGLCVASCETTTTIHTDGAIYRELAASGEVSKIGTLSTDELAALHNLIAQTDFDALRLTPFTDTCPIAYDGQEVIYTIYVEGVEQRLASCEVVIDHDHLLIAYLDTLVLMLEASLTPSPASAVTATATASLTPAAAAGPLVIVWWHGGLCTQGECTGMLLIEPDGQYFTGRYNEANPILAGTLTEAEMTELRALIAQTDFAALRATPFTGTCPTAYDGREMIYTFTIDGVQQELASCEVEIDPTHPLIAWLDALVW